MILEFQHLTFGFIAQKQILQDISLSLEPKKVYALMGSNGAGKTTLFNIISGFLKPQFGKIIFAGENMTSLLPYKINRMGIGRTFQDNRLINTLTVSENIVLAMKHNPTDEWVNAMLPETFHKKIRAALDLEANAIAEQFFLGDIQDTLADEISYGQQKLLSLACCVANGANLLLLDEPVAGIQPEYRTKIATLILQLKEQGKTFLVIEHNTEFIADIADKIFFLHDGNISTFKDMDALRSNKLVMESYI